MAKRKAADPIAGLLAYENEKGQRARVGALRDAEDVARRAMEREAEARNARIAPAVKAAHRAFHDAAIPTRFRKFAWVKWDPTDGGAINYDWRSLKAYSTTIHLKYTISVGGCYIGGSFCAESVEDCQAEGWKVWPAVEALLRAYTDYWREEKREYRPDLRRVSRERSVPVGLRMAIDSATKDEGSRLALLVASTDTVRDALVRGLAMADDRREGETPATNEEIIQKIMGDPSSREVPHA